MANTGAGSDAPAPGRGTAVRAGIAAGAAYVLLSYGFFLTDLAFLAPLTAAFIVGLALPRAKAAGLTAFAAVAAGAVVAPMPALSGGGPAVGAAAHLLLAAGASVVAFLLGTFRGRARTTTLVIAVFTVLFAGLWSTTVVAAREEGGVAAFLSRSVTASDAVTPQGVSDPELYLLYADGIREGRGYYRNASAILSSDPRHLLDTASPLTYRAPTLYAFLALLPRGGLAVPLAFIALASGVMVLGYRALRTVLTPAFALLGPIALAPYAQAYALGVKVLYPEGWAGLLAAAAVSCALLAWTGRGRRARLAWAAAGLAATAVAVREVAVFVPAALLAGALLDPDARVHRRWLPWAAALGAGAALYAAHVVAVARVAVPVSGPTAHNVFRPGLEFALAALQWSQGYEGWLRAAVPLALLAAVLAGARSRPTIEQRASLLLLVGAPIAMFLLFRSPARLTSGELLAYWGSTVMPTVHLFAPLAFGAARKR